MDRAKFSRSKKILNYAITLYLNLVVLKESAQGTSLLSKECISVVEAKRDLLLLQYSNQICGVSTIHCKDLHANYESTLRKNMYSGFYIKH